MSPYLFIYDIHKGTDEQYKAIDQEIRKHYANNDICERVLESNWLIHTEEPMSVVKQKLEKIVPANGMALIVKASSLNFINSKTNPSELFFS